MQRLTTTLTVALIIAICAGCASTPNTAAPELVSSYKRIGVVSITAQVFSRQYVGFTMFGNELEQIDSSSWDIDSKYEQQIATELSSLGGFEVVQGAYSRPEFLHLTDQNRGPNWDAVEIPIKGYCAKNQVGAILATFAVNGRDFIGGTNQSLRGAGFYVRGTNAQSYLHLISGVALVDCQTILRASPLKAAPLEVARAPLKQLTEAQVATIRSELVELPKKSWAPTLRAIFGK